MARGKRNYWTIIETTQISSRDASVSLRDAGYTSYSPLYREALRNGIRRVRALFPNYLLVLVNRDTVSRLRGLRGVVQLFPGRARVGAAEISREFVRTLRECEDELGYVTEAKLKHHREKLEQLVENTPVRGLYGLFEGQRGVFLGYEAGDIARVQFSILGGRELVAHVDAHELVAA